MDFDQWWKEEGRFIPPLDQITNSVLVEQFQAVAKAAYEEADNRTFTALDDEYNRGWIEATLQKVE